MPQDLPLIHKRRVLIIGGQFSGLFAAKELKKHFHVTIVDAKEFFEYTPGILRCFVKPAHFDSLTFTLQPVIERSMGCKFIWGEVRYLDGEKMEADVRTFCDPNPDNRDFIKFDYCLICAGCNFGMFHKWGESLWFPTIHEAARPEGSWPHIDERFLEGRRRHILEEYQKIQELAKKNGRILVVGAGFIGVEWVTELQYYFPSLDLTIMDMLPICLGPLPRVAADYCQEYMLSVGIHTFYLKKWADTPEFLEEIGFKGTKPDARYDCVGVKSANFFMPEVCLTPKGKPQPGFIWMNWSLQVTKGPGGPLWGNGKIFALGDCNAGYIGPPPWDKPTDLPIVPKISYPGEEQAVHACKNVEILDQQEFGKHPGCFNMCMPVRKELVKTWWPWGAGMFSTSLGPHDSCFVLAASSIKHSGYMVNWSYPAALQKELIETTKVNECRNGWIGTLGWHFVHHTPVHLWGKGPWRL